MKQNLEGNYLSEPKTPRILAEFKSGLDDKKIQSNKQILIEEAWLECDKKKVKKKSARRNKAK